MSTVEGLMYEYRHCTFASFGEQIGKETGRDAAIS